MYEEEVFITVVIHDVSHNNHPVHVFAESLVGKLIVNGQNILTAADYTVQCGEGKAVYDPYKKILTLTNATMNQTYVGGTSNLNRLIYNQMSEDLVIELVGDNKLGKDVTWVTDCIYSRNGTYKKIKTVKGKSNTSFIDTKRNIGTTYYYKVRAYKTFDNKNIYSKYTTQKKIKVRPFAPKFKLKQKGMDLVVTWTKKSYADGYQIANTNKGKMKVVKTTKQSLVPKYTSNYWRTGHSYKYKIRSYKIVKGKRVYSPWSKIKQVKIK